MASDGDVTLEIEGEPVVLMPEHALWLPERRTLLVADAHFGKAATFRAGGIFVPRGTTATTPARLDAALARTDATRIVFLGDLLHARKGRSPETLRRGARRGRASFPWAICCRRVRGGRGSGGGGGGGGGQGGGRGRWSWFAATPPARRAPLGSG